MRVRTRQLHRAGATVAEHAGSIGNCSLTLGFSRPSLRSNSPFQIHGDRGSAGQISGYQKPTPIQQKVWEKLLSRMVRGTRLTKCGAGNWSLPSFQQNWSEANTLDPIYNKLVRSSCCSNNICTIEVLLLLNAESQNQKPKVLICCCQGVVFS